MNTAPKTRGLAALLAVLAQVAALPALAQVTVVEGWVSATAPGATETAAYLVLANNGAAESSLMKIVSPASDEVMLHRTSITAEGVARMWPLAGLELDAGQTLRMNADGVHVMLKALKAPLVAGEKMPLTLKFSGGQPEFTVMLDIRPAPARGS